MRHLVACPACHQQYDASGRPWGSRFRCLCGQSLRVPRPNFHDAAVVRCSSCGAPREEQALSCRFCSADFTLHERDLQTICPGCMARVSDRARFCHHCATPLLAALPAGKATSFPCPACRGTTTLYSRSLGQPALPVLECPRCAGLWLGRKAFELLLERSRIESSWPALASEIRVTPNLQSKEAAVHQPLYRACPLCGELMHRRNYGRKSAVIIDSCKAHGVWFDADELEDLLRWVRRGGESQAEGLLKEEQEQLERQVRLRKATEPSDTGWSPSKPAPGGFLDFIGWLLGSP